MFTVELVGYLEELRAHNNKLWFEENRARYDELRSHFTEQVDRIIAASSKFDADLSGIDTRSALFRINRDIRFSKDKSPYKTTFSAALSPGKKEGGRPGYYLCIDADGELLVGAGVHEPPAPQLQTFRRGIANSGKKLEAILAGPRLQKSFGALEGERLKNVPRDFPTDHSYAEYLKHKSFTVSRSEPVTKISDDTFAPHISDLFAAAYPLVRFLREISG
ncbi:MAG TPA: DUF2461 domain-containing protein [Capsulimonadaceae bacterium]|nr:DUF2461 domain-containing protein [Capsulimonadaceae bacterium]